MNIRQKKRIFFFFIHAITILPLFTYSVCDKKVKRIYFKFLISKLSLNIKEHFIKLILVKSKGKKLTFILRDFFYVVYFYRD